MSRGRVTFGRREFRMASGNAVAASIEGGSLTVDIPGTPHLHLRTRPFDQHAFYTLELDYVLRFEVGPRGRATGLIAKQGDGTTTGERTR